MPGNKALIYRNIPDGLPVAGKDLIVEQADYDASNAVLPDEGGLLFQNIYGSLDPYYRLQMVTPEADFVVPPLTLNKPVIGLHIAKVLKSHNNPDYQPGDLVTGYFPFQEVHVLPNSEIPKVKLYRIENPYGLDIRHYLGILGHTGLTAFSSLREICKPKPGETIFVSAASGAVGQAVGLFAKREGLKVIGSVGSDAKLDYIINELGFDGGFNYKKEKPGDALKRLAPEGIDIYYENVGGEHLEAALLAMRPYGRIAVSGMISQYNKPYGQYQPLRNIWEIMPRRLTMTGFVATEPQYQAYRKEHQETVQRWMKEGSVKEKLWEVQGIDTAIDGFIALFTGETFGKAVLKY
ncbi:hypothetical protein VTN49DRAFT_4506 [Thermomyces lanuginosus]|uniref:uncharacterized protein n=1 Tax=Thermomyces lanuginosus TaxID=5541 RepID=UPI003742F58F